MSRNEFAKVLVRYVLFALLAFIAILAGKKAVTGDDCSSCPGNGLCSGKVDCPVYLKH
jgi:hypothetical protein